MSKLEKHRAGWQVKFTNPSTKQVDTGKIVEEVWAREPEDFEETAPANDGWRQAAFVAQLIEWGGGYRSVRITYYLRPERGRPDSWYFGGQYSPSMSVEDFHGLLKKLNERNW